MFALSVPRSVAPPEIRLSTILKLKLAKFGMFYDSVSGRRLLSSVFGRAMSSTGRLLSVTSPPPQVLSPGALSHKNILC